ncbi:MAG TPA: hypothetical protein VJK06_06185 [Methyloceanibacter sp.]|jgi:hypothetical protein|nr:hypothetical protein [Methyloceanibacter sp.]
MNTLRAIVIALIAVSVLMLPIQAATAIAGSMAPVVVTQLDCCDHGQPCQGKNAGGCEQLAGCTLKCGSAAAGILGAASRTLPLPETAKPPFLTRSLFSAPENPPLPPPRV